MLKHFVEAMSEEKHFASILRHQPIPPILTVDLNKPYCEKKRIKFAAESARWVESRTKKGYGVHEPGLVQALYVLRKLLGPQPDRAFYDVGSLHGYCALMAAAILDVGSSFAFEMNPVFTAGIRNNLSLNDHLDTHLHVINAGVSNKTRLQVPCHYHGFALRVEPDKETVASLETEGFDNTNIDIITLDHFLALTGLAPSVVKIDVEGSQMSILKGATTLLKRFSPVLFIESDNQSAVNHEGISMSEICEFLMTDFGYEIMAFNHRDWGFDVIYNSTINTDFGSINLEKNRLFACFPT